MQISANINFCLRLNIFLAASFPGDLLPCGVRTKWSQVQDWGCWRKEDMSKPPMNQTSCLMVFNEPNTQTIAEGRLPVLWPWLSPPLRKGKRLVFHSQKPKNPSIQDGIILRFIYPSLLTSSFTKIDRINAKFVSEAQICGWKYKQGWGSSKSWTAWCCRLSLAKPASMQGIWSGNQI